MSLTSFFMLKLNDIHHAQGLNYLVAYKLDKGLLLNFGAQSLQVKRLRHPLNKLKPDSKNHFIHSSGKSK